MRGPQRPGKRVDLGGFPCKKGARGASGIIRTEHKNIRTSPGHLVPEESQPPRELLNSPRVRCGWRVQSVKLGTAQIVPSAHSENLVVVSLLLTLSLLNGGHSQESHIVEFIAHRGESADAPENTLAAFKLAWDRGVPAIELDVHLTSDDRLVVIHDATTKRTTGVDLTVKELTFEQLQSLDAGSWKGEQWADEPLPSLEDALATIPDGRRCFIEIKTGPESIPALIRAVNDSGKTPEQLVVISFYPETIAEAKRHLPELPMYFLSGFQQDKETGDWTPTTEELINTALDIKADGLNLNFRGPIDEEMLAQIREAGLSLYLWTVDDLDAAQGFVDLGVDGITSNIAARLQEALTGIQSP